MKEEILNLKEEVLKTYSSQSRHTLKKTSTGSKRTSKFNLVLQIQKSCLGKNRFKSIPQNPGEILRQFSSVKENELSPYKEILTKTVKVIPKESPHILIK
jgi:hypothetical protein